MIRKIVYLFFIFEVIGVYSNATAAEVWTHMSKSGRIGFVVIEGKIEKGDFKKFETSVFKANGKISGVYTFSSGGDFYEAMKIGSAVRELGLSTQAPMKEIDNSPFCPTDVLKVSPYPKDEKNCTCASACFFIHIAGLHRGGNYLAVHRPYFKKGKYGSLSQADAQSLYAQLQKDARAYMKKMDVPQHIQEDLMSTPSDKALILGDNVIKKYFWGSLPYRDEK